MQLNDLAPAPGATHAKRRAGRGIGSGLGKTAGRGHKGQKSRSGGFHKVGFEGGQMPLQRRLPKRGFVSLSRGDTAEVLLSSLDKLQADIIDLAVLKQAGLVPRSAHAAKVILSGKISRALNVNGVRVSKGARAAIAAAGGSVADIEVKQDGTGKKAKRKLAAAAKIEAIRKSASEQAAVEPVKAAKGKAKKEPAQAGDKKSAKPAAKKESGKESGKQKGKKD